jgi:hypothetical protein
MIIACPACGGEGTVELACPRHALCDCDFDTVGECPECCGVGQVGTEEEDEDVEDK